MHVTMPQAPGAQGRSGGRAIARGRPRHKLSKANKKKSKANKKKSKMLANLARLMMVGGEGALWAAAFQGTVDDVKRLLAGGASIEDTGDESGSRPLHRAALRSGGVQITRLLVLKGADVNSTGHGGWTPLHVAAHHGREKIALILLQHGADILAENENGKPPLYYATMALTEKKKKRLNETPVKVAARQGVARLLRDFGAEVPPPHPDPSKAKGAVK